MNSLVLRWLLNTLALALTAWFIPGIHITGIAPAFFAALVLGVVNAIIRPIVILFTLPLNVLTLGLFTLVINGLMLQMVSGLVRGFDVSGFWAAFFGSLVLSVISMVLSWFVSED
ncbi:phage holin family protein [Heliobacillus mobilis]|uniref:Phage holin family protein n=2 Tax=Heliobacterium TaxID=2697 RepID=A0A6I3SMU6_HELMO|nr:MULTISPECIES: phage holin family protein [Heliobacterium]MBC9784275.1 phage holin family protein [Heliobacterium chlorum]MTV50321.1 phage holin family protein [Heliobacterium mobile]